MKLNVTGRRVTVTEPIRQQIDRKVRRLERLLNDRAVSAQIVLSEERQGTACEMTVQVAGGRPLHGLGRDQRITTAVGQAVEKVAQQATRLNKRQRAHRHGHRRMPAPPAEASSFTPRRRVIRSSAADIKPMTLDDAVLELEGSDRTFLVFRLATSERMALLFRRADGHFGLVEPEV